MHLNNEYRARHLDAMADPLGLEVPIVTLLKGLRFYVDAYRDRYGSSAFDDAVLSEGIASIADGIRIMLDGECGRLDCGIISSYLCEVLKRCGRENV